MRRPQCDAHISDLELLRWQEWIPIIAEASTSTELHSWGSTVRCSRLVGPSVVLLGDAGHAVTPNLGQGCNSSLEDVGIFHKVIIALRRPHGMHGCRIRSERPLAYSRRSALNDICLDICGHHAPPTADSRTTRLAGAGEAP